MTPVDALSTLLPSEALDARSLGAPALGRPPEAVVRPASPEEVSTLMAWATREGVGVLPLASGRRSRPVAREGRYVALSTDRLAGIEDYEAANLTLTAGAGTPFTEVAGALAENGQWAPFDPPHVDDRSLGGLVATGESGPLRMGYGELRHHVLGMTVVTGDGRALDLGGRVVKNVAGYDVLKPVVGSRGTLAVVTSVCIRAFPRPLVDRVLALRGASVEALLEPASAVGTAPILPASAVLVDRLGAEGDGPALVVRLHGAEATVDADQVQLEEHVGTSFEELDRGVLARLRDHAADHDVVVRASVLPSRLPDLLTACAPLAAEAVWVDAYHGLVRLGATVARDGVLADLRRGAEAAGGAVDVFARSPEVDGATLGSRPSAGEAALIHRLRTAFDPGEVLWPARR